MLELKWLERHTEERLRLDMSRHYSAPGGFVGRSLCFGIFYNQIRYGSIVAGSALMHLPGRDVFFNLNGNKVNDIQCIINCTFFHIEKVDNTYPVRNFGQKILKEWRRLSVILWSLRYGDKPIGFETLIELPRTGEVFRRDGWRLIGETRGFTCKRAGGKGTDSYGGRRVWNREALRPKHVFVRSL